MDKLNPFIEMFKDHWIFNGEDIEDLSAAQWEKISCPIGIENKLKKLVGCQQAQVQIQQKPVQSAWKLR